MSIEPKISGIKQICVYDWPSKMADGSSTKKCQKLLIVAHKTEISDVPTGWWLKSFLWYILHDTSTSSQER